MHKVPGWGKHLKYINKKIYQKVYVLNTNRFGLILINWNIRGGKESVTDASMPKIETSVAGANLRLLVILIKILHQENSHLLM